jgi:SIR2-like domain
VLAMQGNVSMQTMAQFTPVFFRELQQDGQIDRAMALARGAVRGRPDAWMPVLFMRLKSGRIWWYVPGFARTSEGFKKWPALLPRIQEGTGTPILGPGLVEPLIGSSRSLAQRWAKAHDFPLAPNDRDDLPQVAQYLAVKYDLQFPREELGRYVRNELLQQYGSSLPDELQGAPLDEVLEAVWAQRQAANPAEAHRVLARFPFKIYITANPDNLLARALEDAGKEPEVALCPWNRYVEEQVHSIYDEEPGYQPTPKRPLVYHLFGQLREPRSLVLTEDDHFKYLIGVTRNRELIPEEVRRALTDSALLFLGFQLRDWNFRVLFHSLIGQEVNPRLLDYAHVGVQIDPEERRILEPEGARQYLEDYFKGAHVNIYWGSTEDFVKELLPRSLAGSAGDGSRAAQGASR